MDVNFIYVAPVFDFPALVGDIDYFSFGVNQYNQRIDPTIFNVANDVAFSINFQDSKIIDNPYIAGTQIRELVGDTLGTDSYFGRATPRVATQGGGSFLIKVLYQIKTFGTEL